jgi:hypothetical protein
VFYAAEQGGDLVTSNFRCWSLAVLVAFAFLIGASACTARYREFQLRQTPNLRAPVEAYARLLLLREADKLLRAVYPYQWIGYRFHLGVCFPGTIDEMEREDQRTEITFACEELKSVQDRFPPLCGDEAGCPLAEEAADGIEAVILWLEQAEPIFAEAEAGTGGIPNTE